MTDTFRSRAHRFSTLAALVALTAVIATSAAGAQADLDIPYEKFVLDNGLTLIVHEDHKAPIVAVNLWYHVGSKNEKPGKTGFAHLFEHLMFNGSEHYNDDYFKPLEKIGVTDINGTTNPDRTNYFQNVPVSALDLALWMESDRMGHLLGVIDQDRLDEQRGVVQNEKRQGENRPYGLVRQLITENTYPEGHPYSWSTIGSMEDLEAASLDDVHEWFRTYYGAANAVIAIAGDITASDARARVEKYFGDIPAGPPVARHKTWIAKRTGSHRQVAQDRVPQARLYKVWNTPEWSSVDTTHLDLVTTILGYGKNSRFYRRLVYEDQIATNASAFIAPREIAGSVRIVATAQTGVELSRIEEALDEELDKFLRDGPTDEELERVKTQYRADFIRGIERVGGFGGKSDILAMNETYGGRPDFFKVTLERVANATAEDLRQAAVRWLSDGVYLLEVHPYPDYQTTEVEVDRSRLPEITEFPDLRLPGVAKGRLSNGLDVVLATRSEIPVVDFELIVDAGYAADPEGISGLASLTLDLLDEGTDTRSALGLGRELERLGAQLSTYSSHDSSSVTMSALKENLDRSLDVFADVVLNPTFLEDEFDRRRKQRVEAIRQQKSSPNSIPLRLLPGLLYGDSHPYGVPWSGIGTEDSLATLSRDDLERFHSTWFQPSNARLVVVGDTSLDELLPLLEERLGDWKDTREPPSKNLPAVDNPSDRTLYVVDRPGAQQSIIIAAALTTPANDPERTATATLNRILGGAFTSRINMNLREDKHWSYGSRSMILDTRGQRMLFVQAPVQSDKTIESFIEIDRELREIIGSRPPTADELDKAKKSQTRGLPGRFETKRAVLRALAQTIELELEEGYWAGYGAEVDALTVDDVTAAANELLAPDHMVWMVVGDRALFEDQLGELGFDQVHFVDADGQPVD